MLPEIIASLITDRTYFDVERAYYLENKWVNGEWTGTADEFEEWENNPKGEYRYSDINRVKEAIGFTAKCLYDIGYFPDIKIIPDYYIPDLPTFNALNDYIYNIKSIQNVLPKFPSMPEAPDNLDKLTYQTANNIEKIVVQVYKEYENITKAWIQSGQINSGFFDFNV